MSAGLSGAAIAGIAGGALSLGSSIINANGAQSAADTQSGAADAGVNEQNYEFNTIRGLLKPFVDTGTGSLTGYNNSIGNYAQALGGYQNVLGQLHNLTGANGIQAQQTAINGLQQQPLYTTSMNLGQQAILANASATGGLRGGNTIASLGYLPGQVLSNVMQTQIGNLNTSLNGQLGLLNGANTAVGQWGGLAGLGENAAAGTGNAALQTGNNITSLLGQKGAIGAGATLAGTNAITGALNQGAGLLGAFGGSGFGAAGGGGLASLWSSAAGAGGTSGLMGASDALASFA